MVNINNLKNNIEKEITKIDTLYDQVNKETTKSFELKHEQLTKEENELKEKLQNEVTKVKEKMEKSLSKINNIIKICEKIKKGIKTLEKEKKI
jgi:biopolymer transport protein ExbB/TolQ